MKITSVYKFFIVSFLLLIFIVFIMYLISNFSHNYKRIYPKKDNKCYIEKVIIKYLGNNEYSFSLELNKIPDKKYERIYMNIYPYNKEEVFLNVKNPSEYMLNFIFAGFQISNCIKVNKDKILIVNKKRLYLSKTKIEFGLFNPKEYKDKNSKFLNRYLIFANFRDIKNKGKIEFIHPFYFLKKLNKYFLYSFLVLIIFEIILFVINKNLIFKFYSLIYPEINIFSLFCYLVYYGNNLKLSIFILIFSITIFFLLLVIKRVKLYKGIGPKRNLKTSEKDILSH